MNKAKAPEPVPILIIIAYWEGDRALCKKMVDLMVDMQPHHVGRACEVLLICRQDCIIDEDMVKKLMTRFNLRTFKTTSPLRGWPGGCNGMFGSSMTYVANSSFNVDCVFWMEADCVPTAPNWFSHLARLWKQRKAGVNVMGDMLDCDGNGKGLHITGCALYDRKFAKILPRACSCGGVAWDYHYRKEIVAMGEKIGAIRLYYKAANATPDIISQDEVVLIHGFKDDSLIKLVRKKWNV